VSSSLKTQQLPSIVTINLYQQPANITENSTRALVISGSISPAYSGQNITIYVDSNKVPEYYFTTVTDDNGAFASTLNFTSTGTYNVTASWNGDSTYAGTDSQTLTIFVGPQSFIQFQAQDYNYIFGLFGSASYAANPILGVNDFLSIHLGTNVSFSYDFIVLPAGHAVSNVQTATLMIPQSKQTVRLANGQTKTEPIPGENITVPVNVPSDMQPLRLPDEFNQSINNQFCFILQSNSEGNYSLNVNALNADDISNVIQSAGSDSDFNNVSQNINDNTWYQTTTTISNNGVTSNLFSANGTLIESTTNNNAVNNSKSVTLITNNQDAAVVFKNLKIESLNQIQQPHDNEKTTSSTSIILYIALLIMLTATVTSLFCFKRKKSLAANKRIN
jgi:hypothetical protein